MSRLEHSFQSALFSNRELSAVVSLESVSGASKMCQVESPESTQFLAAAQIK